MAVKQQIPSPDLAKITGPEPIDRFQAMKKIWAYIKEHKLQGTAAGERQTIRSDAVLAPIFKAGAIKQTQLPGLLTPHLK